MNAVMPLSGFVFALVTIVIVLQVVGGNTFLPVKFRRSQPQAYWTVIAAYCVVLIGIAVIFLLWR